MDLKINNIARSGLTDIQKGQINRTDKEFRFTVLSKVAEEQLQIKLNGLLNDITIQGKILTEHMDIRYMKAYRGLITEFFNEIISHSHKFKRENFLDRRGRHRVYGILKLVDQHLDELAKELMSSESKAISILNTVDEIRGLLLDLLT